MPYASIGGINFAHFAGGRKLNTGIITLTLGFFIFSLSVSLFLSLLS